MQTTKLDSIKNKKIHKLPSINNKSRKTNNHFDQKKNTQNEKTTTKNVLS